jgi:hypothetical protein
MGEGVVGAVGFGIGDDEIGEGGFGGGCVGGERVEPGSPGGMEVV